VDAFDADVLIYAAVPGHVLGRRVRALFPIEPTDDTGAIAGTGSVLLIPELLTKPMRNGDENELDALAALLSRLELRPTDEATANLATALGHRTDFAPPTPSTSQPQCRPGRIASSPTMRRTSRRTSPRST